MSRSRQSQSGFNLGVDVGGTFTDVVCIGDDGRIVTGKSPTTPSNQADGILNGIAVVADRLGLSREDLLSQTSSLVHGTTTATNIMLEFDGAVTFMLTTKGMRDILDIRRNIKEAAFSLRLPAPHPIVPRGRRLPIAERVNYLGEVLAPLDEDDVRRAAARMAEEGAEAVAICYLFSFLNGDHELRTREILLEELPDLHVSLSHEVLPRIREFERFSTTAVDAYVAPRLNRYLRRLESELRESGFQGELLVMKSNGGVTEVTRQRKSLGVELVASGPAGGVVAAAQLGTKVGDQNVITMDMGGTSLDASLVENSAPRVGTEAWTNRHRVAVPIVDVESVGAGGGSIAWVDDGGDLRIGPQSAGAEPGPACYGRGGTRPTVTDADLVLGFLGADYFLAGRSKLDLEASREAIRVHVAEPLGMSIEEAAQAIFRIVNHSMANAIRLVSISRGYDPRDFAMMAFGGGGPLHAGALVEDLGIRRILVPRTYAPVLCALGDTLSDIRESVSRGVYMRDNAVDTEAIRAGFAELAERAEEDMSEEALRLPGRVDRAVNMRYLGQTHEVTVPVEEDLADGDFGPVVKRFHELHKQQFTFSRPEVQTEVIGLQIDRWAFRETPDLQGATRGEADPDAQNRQHAKRDVLFAEATESQAIDVYQGESLEPGFSAKGPLIVQEAHTALVVYPGQTVTLHESDVYVVEIEDNNE